jgi:hypothetical protein
MIVPSPCVSATTRLIDGLDKARRKISFDFSSMLAYVEHIFGFEPLYDTDAAAYDYAQSFDHSQAPLAPVRLEANPLPRGELRWLKEHQPANDAT